MKAKKRLTNCFISTISTTNYSRIIMNRKNTCTKYNKPWIKLWMNIKLYNKNINNHWMKLIMFKAKMMNTQKM